MIMHLIVLFSHFYVKIENVLSDVVAEITELEEAELLDSLILTNVVPGITELWVEIYQKINCRDVTSIWEGRASGTLVENGLISLARSHLCKSKTFLKQK